MDSINNQTKSDIALLHSSIDSLDQNLQSGVAALNERINLLEVHLETFTEKRIQLIAEGHIDLIRKLEDASKSEREKELFQVRLNYLEGEVRRIKQKIQIA